MGAADKTSNAKVAHEALSNKEADGSIAAAFERVGKGKVTYSHCQHTKLEARYIYFLCCCSKKVDIERCRAEFVRWVAENKRPFQVVNDRAFRSLMKTGRPECYIPSAKTLSCDVKNVFVNARKRIAEMLQVSFHSNNTILDDSLWFRNMKGS